MFLSCVTVLTHGELRSPKKIYTLTMEEEEKEEEEKEEEAGEVFLPYQTVLRYIFLYRTQSSVNIRPDVIWQIIYEDGEQNQT